MEHFSQRWQYEVHRWNYSSLKENVSLVSLFVVEMLYWWRFDLYCFRWKMRFLWSSFCILNISEHYCFSVQRQAKIRAFRVEVWVAPKRQKTNICRAAISLTLTWHGRATREGISTSELSDPILIEGRPAISRYVTRRQNFFFHSFEWSLN